MITMKEAADALDGNEYGSEGSRELFARMKEARLVAVYGASDDIMEFDGAVRDEIGAYDGGTAYFTKYGLLQNDCDDDNCPHFEKLKGRASSVYAAWCPDDMDVSWAMVTDLPHERFRIMEGDDVYCLGLVFSLDDCAE